MRYIIACLIVIGLIATPATAQAKKGGPCFIKWDYTTGPSARNHMAEMRILTCAIRHWPVSGGFPKAHYIAHRESGPLMWHRAINTYSGACGIFQHIQRYWPSRVRTYLNPHWFGHRHWYAGNTIPCTNARANIIVGIRMAHAGGWGPWGG